MNTAVNTQGKSNFLAHGQTKRLTTSLHSSVEEGRKEKKEAAAQRKPNSSVCVLAGRLYREEEQGEEIGTTCTYVSLASGTCADRSIVLRRMLSPARFFPPFLRWVGGSVLRAWAKDDGISLRRSTRLP